MAGAADEHRMRLLEVESAAAAQHSACHVKALSARDWMTKDTFGWPVSRGTAVFGLAAVATVVSAFYSRDPAAAFAAIGVLGGTVQAGLELNKHLAAGHRKARFAAATGVALLSGLFGGLGLSGELESSAPKTPDTPAGRGLSLASVGEYNLVPGQAVNMSQIVTMNGTTAGGELQFQFHPIADNASLVEPVRKDFAIPVGGAVPVASMAAPAPRPEPGLRGTQKTLMVGDTALHINQKSAEGCPPVISVTSAEQTVPICVGDELTISGKGGLEFLQQFIDQVQMANPGANISAKAIISALFTDQASGIEQDFPGFLNVTLPGVAPSASVTPSPKPDSSASATPSPTYTVSFSNTPTPSISVTSSRSPTPSTTVTRTVTASITPSGSPSATSTMTSTSTKTASGTMTQTASTTQSSSATGTQTSTRTSTASFTPSGSASPSSSASVTSTSTTSASGSVSTTTTASVSSTGSPTMTQTRTSSTSASSSATRTATSSWTPTRTPSPTPTAYPVPTVTPGTFDLPQGGQIALNPKIEIANSGVIPNSFSIIVSDPSLLLALTAPGASYDSGKLTFNPGLSWADLIDMFNNGQITAVGNPTANPGTETLLTLQVVNKPGDAPMPYLLDTATIVQPSRRLGVGVGPFAANGLDPVAPVQGASAPGVR